MFLHFALRVTVDFLLRLSLLSFCHPFFSKSVMGLGMRSTCFPKGVHDVLSGSFGVSDAGASANSSGDRQRKDRWHLSPHSQHTCDALACIPKYTPQTLVPRLGSAEQANSVVAAIPTPCSAPTSRALATTSPRFTAHNTPSAQASESHSAISSLEAGRTRPVGWHDISSTHTVLIGELQNSPRRLRAGLCAKDPFWPVLLDCHL